MRPPLYLLILTLTFIYLPVSVLSQSNITVEASSRNINTLATYTFTLRFSDTGNRSQFYLFFPSELTLSNSTSVQLGTQLLNSSVVTIYSSNSTIAITTRANGTVVFVINNVRNPTAAISSSSFSAATNNASDTFAANIFNTMNYIAGALQSCLYTFAGTTEQANSTLNVVIVLGNTLTIGSNRITIGYPIRWANSNTKSLTHGSPTINCSYIMGTFTSSLPCSYDSTSIYVTLSLTTPLQAGTSVTIQVNNVNCPPTATTATSASFTVSTSDYTLSTIDTLSSCNISQTSLSTAEGTFTNSGLFISSVYSTPQINYSSTVPVTFQAGDTMAAYYSVTTTTCASSLFLNRSTPLTWTFTNMVGTVRYYTYNSADNNGSNSVIQLYMDCSFTTPPSAQPTYFYFLFRRGTSNYLNLTATFTALPVAFTNTAKFVATLGTREAVVASTYTFTITLSYPISRQGVITIIMPRDIRMSGFTNSSCGATIGGSNTALSNCNFTTSSNTRLNFYFNTSSSIQSGTRIVATVVNLNNPNYAYSLFSLGINTYYNASQPLSLVEYNSSLITLSYTTYTTNNLAINPTTYSVFSTVTTNISYLNQVYLQSGTQIRLTFPSQITSLTFSNITYSNSTLRTISVSSVSTTAPFTLTFTSSNDIPIGTNMTIPITIRTPSNLGTYGPIQLSTSYNSFIYEQSSFLQLAVTETSPISVTITPSQPYTGRRCMYSFTLSTFMPHSKPSFYLLISFPSASAFTAVGNCNGSCNASFGMLNTSTINVTINNSANFTNNVYSYTIRLGNFTNPRHIGTSQPWNFFTYNSDGTQVGSGTATLQITLASPLAASLSSALKYYRGNTQPVLLYLTLYNTLTANDYILLQFARDTYTNASGTVSCPTNIATCSISNYSTSNVLVVIAYPNANQLNNTAVTIQISGLVSASGTIYNEIVYFNVSTYTSQEQLIDQGAAAYSISCGQQPSYNCKQCFSNNSCSSCYTNEGMNLLSGRCVSNCTLETQYFSYNQSGSCLACSSPCFTCYNSTACRTCITNYYYYQNYSCLSTCNLANKFYTTNVGGILYCFKCFDQANCLVCTNGSSNACTLCENGVLQQGKCNLDGCTIANTYLDASSICQTCDGSCNGCTGAGNSRCTSCNFGYFNTSGYCVSSCPTGTAPILSTQVCSCEGSCITCRDTSSYCLSCTPDPISGQARFAYLGSCRSSCPLYSYLSGQECLLCHSGCYNCSAISCFNCDADKYSFQNKCFQDCNSAGQQYDGDSTGLVKKCVLCPNGCDTCSGYNCTSCLSGYSLQGSTCLEICIVLGNCQSPVPDKVLPLPGMIVVGVWAIIVVVVKLLISKVYVPYSLLFTFCLVQFGLVLSSISVLNQSQRSSSVTTIARLLIGMDYSYRSVIMSLLVASLVLNYLMNLLYILIFCKYLKPLLVNPRQIDYITNYILITFSFVSNFRLGLMAFSKMFPKPYIPINNSSRLTPLNYLCIFSLILDIIPLSAAIYLILKQSAGANLFMLGVDLVIVLSLNAACSIYMVAVPKSEDYYATDVKRTTAEEHYKTEEDLNNDKNESMSKLGNTFNHLQKHQPFNDELFAQHAIDNQTMLIMASNPQNEMTLQSQESNPPLTNVHHTTRKQKITINQSKQLNTNSDNIEDLEEIIQFQPSTLPNKANSAHSEPASDPIENKRTQRNIRQSHKIAPLSKNKDKKAAQKGEDHRAKIIAEQSNLEPKMKETAVNFSKQHIKRQSPLKHVQSALVHRKVSHEPQARETSDNDMEAVLVKNKNHTLAQRKSTEIPINQVRSKHRPRRSERGERQSEPKIFTKKDAMGESGPSDAEQQVGHINLDQILESKIKQSKKINEKMNSVSTANGGKDPREDISPSWFNAQNQRFSIQELE